MAEQSSKPTRADFSEKVGRHYDQIWAMEAARLEKWSPVEYAMMLRYLKRYVPDGATVAELGVGVGHYSEALARRGCTMHLVDVSERLLEAAKARLQECGLARGVGSVTHGSATELGFLADGSVDVVLALGPLYHLWELRERQRMVAEAARVLRPGGLLFAAGINRLTYFRDMFRKLDIPGVPAALIDEIQGRFRRELRQGTFAGEYLATGRLDPEHAPPIGYAFMTTLCEFRELFADSFEQVLLAGLESFTSPSLEPFANIAEEDRDLWLDLVERTNTTPEGLAYSDHFLFLGRRP